MLGIKYEAAILGGVDEAGLAGIQEQIREEAGDGWTDDPMVVRGRNAVRAEHGLPPLGAPPRRPADEPGRTGRPWWRKLLG